VTAPTPTFTIVDATGAPVTTPTTAPAAPQPLAMSGDATGAFTGSVALPAGTWDISVSSEGVEPVTRRVTVSPGPGLAGVLELDGGDSYLELAQDGTPVANVSGGIATDGQRVDLTATREITIRAGNAGAVRLTINGISIGAMGQSGAVVAWRITRAGG
jgi:hypothetical protein